MRGGNRPAGRGTVRIRLGGLADRRSEREVNVAVLAEMIGGDPVLLPSEAAAQLGVTEAELETRAESGLIGSVQPGGPGTERRYRQSHVDQAR